MTRKERVKSVLNGEITDVVPFHADLTLKMRDKLADYYSIEKGSVEQFIGNHFLHLSFHGPESPESEGEKRDIHDGGTITTEGKIIDDKHVVDEFGIIWNNEELYDTGDWGMVDQPIKNMNLSGYKFPDGYAPGRFRGVEETVKRNPDRFNVLMIVGLFDGAWHVTSLQDLLLAMGIDDKSFIHNMLDSVLEFNLGVIQQAPDYIDGIRFLEDWGIQHGLMMGLKHWREFLKPRLKIMYEATKKRGFIVMSHSCGDNTVIIPELIELGVDISDPAQPEAMDLKFLKKEYGKDIVFFGGLGSQSTIPRGTPEEVVKEAEGTMEYMWEGGKYILGPAGSIPTEAPIENVAALVEYYKNILGEERQ